MNRSRQKKMEKNQDKFFLQKTGIARKNKRFSTDYSSLKAVNQL